jgi:membrane carboxypeptidase/penicillin-binding protein PbpC
MTRRGEPYIPVNYSRRENGPVLLRQALASSLNIPAVRTLNKVGLPQALATLDEFGLRLPGPAEDYDLALALGGGEISLLDLTRAYAIFANGGSRIAERLILDVRDAQGQTVYTAPPAAPIRVVDARVAWLISDILSDDQARALGFGAHSLLQLDRVVAVKTGTTNDFRDNWTVGYTPDVVVGVWVGNADHQPMREVSGISGAGPIWRSVMRQVLNGTPDKPFARPEGLVQVDICTLSGLLPTEACPYRRSEWFLVGTQPTQPDNFYRLVWLDRATQQLATATTSPALRQQQRVLDLPPEFYPWARAQGLTLLADLAAPASAESITAPLYMDAPAPFTTYRLSPKLPATAQQVRIEAVGSADIAPVTLYLDGQPLSIQQHPPYLAWWPLQPGRHTAWAVGQDAAGRQITSERVSFTVRAVD